MKRTHNKSGSDTLSILEYDNSALILWAEMIKKQVHIVNDGLIHGSPCTLISAQDGRFSVKCKKVAYAYQIIAFQKFGHTALINVPTSKRDEDLVISHLCGTRNCCTSSHLNLEPKKVNDERVHCHFCVRSAYLKGGWEAVALFFQLGCCPHEPCCCSEFLLQ